MDSDQEVQGSLVLTAVGATTMWPQNSSSFVAMLITSKKIPVSTGKPPHSQGFASPDANIFFVHS